MKKYVIVSLHVSFWAIVFLNSSFAIFLNKILSQKEVAIAYKYLELFLPLYFYLSYFLILRVLKNKRLIIYALSTILIFFLVFLFLKKYLFAYSILFVCVSFMWFFVGAMFRLFVDWLDKDKIQLQLSRQNLQSELALLRNQINPHFLFNTIHSIDTLISVNPDKASAFLIKFSEMMRYMIYDTENDFVELDKEVEYVKKFLSLQELRLANNELVTFHNFGLMLPENNFIRIHKSYMIAIDKIDSIERNVIKIKDKRIPIGESFREHFENFLKNSH